jgi:class 3 adenylate cyclase
VTDRVEDVREFTRSCVRAGLLDATALYEEVVLAVRTELPHLASQADVLARTWIAEFTQQLERDQASWPDETDHDRLQAAFADLESLGVAVLQGCEDHWAVKTVLDERAERRPRGVAWFTPPDVWHAIDEGMLEVNLWHGSTANVAPGDTLLDEVVAVFARHGLEAHFDEGRIEVSAHWQRRIDQPGPPQASS